LRDAAGAAAFRLERPTGNSRRTALSQNKRNIDTDELSKPSAGNQQPAGTATHDMHRVEAADEADGNKAKGTAGRKEGYGKGNTRP
jgi:hypothetical protein